MTAARKSFVLLHFSSFERNEYVSLSFAGRRQCSVMFLLQTSKGFFCITVLKALVLSMVVSLIISVKRILLLMSLKRILL